MSPDAEERSDKMATAEGRHACFCSDAAAKRWIYYDGGDRVPTGSSPLPGVSGPEGGSGPAQPAASSAVKRREQAVQQAHPLAVAVQQIVATHAGSSKKSSSCTTTIGTASRPRSRLDGFPLRRTFAFAFVACRARATGTVIIKVSWDECNNTRTGCILHEEVRQRTSTINVFPRMLVIGDVQSSEIQPLDNVQRGETRSHVSGTGQPFRGAVSKREKSKSVRAKYSVFAHRKAINFPPFWASKGLGQLKTRLRYAVQLRKYPAGQRPTVVLSSSLTTVCERPNKESSWLMQLRPLQRQLLSIYQLRQDTIMLIWRSDRAKHALQPYLMMTVFAARSSDIIPLSRLRYLS
ncbi:uncharacterized protein MYCFIDRAFT_173111 [Pseudocercospora fijiensis CIRAD86]|uniref:Uncharacterized protein n=1 Tax=Pseudocercospora fijiensis (strain CIRAD86) TaxID=383855 RepID=M2Z2I3_PSEFD|nr:uncharacterized protein MYCFIDRAFT_173111 [Pseudocercospora fijiensis CIRAD86]EME84055.1 hypothetical protein MYCFIDRAFT_173111 [Pseudocercospora fijiensis CIRAD86]